MNTSINLRVALYFMLFPFKKRLAKPGEFLRGDDEEMHRQLKFVVGYIKDEWKVNAV